MIVQRELKQCLLGNLWTLHYYWIFFYIAPSFVLRIIKQFSFIVKLVVVEEVGVAEVDESHPDDSCRVEEKGRKF